MLSVQLAFPQSEASSSAVPRLVDHIKIPMARASILWLIGEYCDRIPRIAPDVLRKMAKTFINEVGN